MKKKTPLVMNISRGLFAILCIAQVFTWLYPILPQSQITLSWLVYLVIIYAGAEYIYFIFFKKGIDLSYAFPLLFAVYVLNFVSLLVDGQERMPDLNRAEHLTSFVFITYIIWVFFTKYLPQDVWQKHPYYTSILVFAIVSAAGVVNEIVELFLDITFHSKTIGTGFDTNYDLTMNSLGAVLFLASHLIYSNLFKPSRRR